MQVFSGTVLVPGSLLALGAAVGLKTLVFTASERQMRWYRASLAMLAANAVSTVIGLCLAMSAGVPTLLLFFLPGIYLVSLRPARRLIELNPWGYLGGWNRHLIAGLIVLLYVLTWILFGFSQGILSADGSLWSYWLVKFLYIYSALLVSLFLTTLWEEWVVSLCAAKRSVKPQFLPTVLKANLVTMALVFAYAAIRILPQRLSSPDFLVELLRLAV